ncbi:hypothetical protein U1P98_06625 [Lysinibacillus irui]|uniref:Uncharacterized protein n=1 Tax=Lysinibacillus irui TaxID=2998077 RepID=A0ABU5NJ06_9BACI|nr:hypothetical protein [Lysinibacillus irui]MEA0553587.1 hypothetical protein [Lysinibacillus irui]MEA0975971.1 hypothetical protein [Lysinibacillus irui]MEA1042125.1 hypothetical protein [Lysinibacillus irui]
MGKNLEQEGFETPKTQIVSELVERYRTRLLENYKQDIFIKWDEEEGSDLFFTEELLTLAASIIKASENEILELFFEEAFLKCAAIDIKDYFKDLFEAAL